MNYKTIYDNLIAKALNRTLDQPFDRHHILPKSMGGSNDAANIVKLTPREHYLAHLLLLKTTTGKDRSKMAFAMFRFSPKGSPKYGNSKTYDRTRKMLSSALSGENNPFFGRSLSDEHKRKISGVNHGMYGTTSYKVRVEKYGVQEADRLRSEERSKRSASLSGKNNPMFGTIQTEERKASHSEALRSLTTVHKDGKYKRAKGQKLEQLLALGWITR
jgi:hypothetical protein